MIGNALFLLRGLPGSGKTTLAHVLSENGKYPAYSVDDFFTDKTSGEYRFEFEKNHLAYKQCEENVRLAMEQNSAKIFVHNTFTMEWELAPYFKLAARFNYALFVMTVENVHGGKNVHGVSEDQLQKMAEKYKVRLI